MQISKVALFGGALMSAGVAQAQQLDYALNYGGAYPTAFNIANYTQYTSFTPGTPAADAVDVNASATQGATFMDARANDGGFAQSYAYVIQAVDTVVNITWDFTGEDPLSAPLFSDISVVDWAAGGVAVFVIDFQSADPAELVASGSINITLDAGVGYGILLEAGGTGVGGNAFATLNVVPAPGAAALAGLAGLAAVRRRR